MNRLPRVSRTAIRWTVAGSILTLALYGVLRTLRPVGGSDLTIGAADLRAEVSSAPLPAIGRSRPSDRSVSQAAPPLTGRAEAAGDSVIRLTYDESLSFSNNLDALKAACSRWNNPETIAWLAQDLIAALYERVAGNEAVIRAALTSGDVHPYFRAVLLTSLLHGAFPEAADTIWVAALDAQENIDVRRVAAHLLRFLENDVPRPLAYRELLNSPDSITLVAALKVAARHMDSEGYRIVQGMVDEGADLNVRIAATHAMGQAPFDDAQRVLLGIVTDRPTSSAAPFSEASIIKRTALEHLDPTVSAHIELARSMALDDKEEHGVRRKAILKVAESGSDEAESFVVELLERLPEGEALLIKASVEGLLLLGHERGLQAIRAKLASITDPVIRRMIEHQLASGEDMS